MCSKFSFLAGKASLTATSVLLAFLLTAPVVAADRYLPVGHPDGITLLPPPPVASSVEELADLAGVRAVVHGRTKAEEERALAGSSLGFTIFAPAIGPIFQIEKLPKTAALLKQVKQEIAGTIDEAKDHWKRLRPYQLDPELSVGKPEPSFSYPSGHSTRGTVYALVLAELFPEKRQAILQVGRNIGWDRVIIGKHYPTDIYAGRTLGQAIMRELDVSPAFAHDLAEAKAEVQAALAMSHSPASAPKAAPAGAAAAP
jgi:acid phosphatase (class A)